MKRTRSLWALLFLILPQCVSRVDTGPPTATVAALTVVFSASTQTLPADGTTTSTLHVAVTQRNGSPAAGQAVTLSASGSGNSFSVVSGITDATGELTSAFRSTVAETKTVRVQVGSTSQSLLITVGAAAASVPVLGSRCTATPTTQLANGQSQIALQLELADAQGNPIADAGIVLASAGGNVTFSVNAGSGATVTLRSDASGAASATATSTHAGATLITATVGTTVISVPVTFVAGPASVLTSTVSAAPDVVEADGTSESIVMFVARDAFGNFVSGQAVTFSGSGTGNVFSATSSPSGSTLSEVTDGNGRSLAALSSTVVQNQNVQVSFAGSVLATPISFTAGGSTSGNSNIVASPNTQVADNVHAIVLAANINDALGHPVVGQSVVFSASGTGTMLLPSANATTDSSGVAQVNVTSTVAQTQTLSAIFGSTTLSAVVTFAPGAASATASTLVANPNTIAVPGSLALSFVARDAFSNLIANQPVTFSADGSSNAFTNVTGNTNTSGAFSGTLSSTLAQNENVKATFGTNSMSVPVSFAAGATAAGLSTLSASPSTALANNSAAITLTATFHDAQNNPVPNASVTFSGAGSNNAFSPSNVRTTNALGVAVVQLTSPKAQTEVITAAAGTAMPTTSITFTPGPATNLALAATPNSQPADGNSVIPITATVSDANGNGVANQTVSFYFVGGAASLSALRGVTGASGTVNTQLVSYIAGANTVGARAGPLSKQITATFTTRAAFCNQVMTYGNLPPEISGSANAIAATTADFNNDGHRDLALANSSSNAVSVRFGNGTGTFASAANYAVGTLPYDIVSADFNNDGKPDLATANQGSNNISVLLGATGGTFVAAVNYAAGTTPISIDAYDFNADGKTDLVVSNLASNTIGVFLGTGTGTFNPQVSYAAAGAWGLSLADFNVDGKMDVAAASYSGTPGVNVLFGTGTGTFGTAVNYATPVAPKNIGVADFNADGRPDLAAVNNLQVSILLNNGAGTFATALNTSVVIGGLLALNVADYNHDGKADLIAAGIQAGFAEVGFLAGNGNGTFAAMTTWPGGPQPLSLVTDDFNEDGHLDYITLSNQSAYSAVVLGVGDGTFSGPTNYAVGQSPFEVIVGDFTNDAVMDIATPAANSGLVSVLRGHGDGTFAAAVSTSTGAAGLGLAAADMDGDGNLDVMVATIGNTLSYMAGKGDGAFFAPVNYAVGALPRTVQIGDFNNDGALDAATVSTNANSLSVLINTGPGTGTFHPAVAYPGLLAPLNLTINDFDGDGVQDLASSNTGSSNVSVFLGQGDGTFAAAASVPSTGPSGFLASGDLNGDGKIDLVVTRYDANIINILTGSGTGSFIIAAAVTSDVTPSKVLITDFNGDGQADIGVGNVGSVSIMLGTGTGTFTAANIFTYASESQTTFIAASDFNRDGRMDLAAALVQQSFIGVSLNTGCTP